MTRRLCLALCVAAAVAAPMAQPSPVPASTRQLVVVTTPAWTATAGTLQRYERAGLRCSRDGNEACRVILDRDERVRDGGVIER